jgi:FkbM family methyltransferase
MRHKERHQTGFIKQALELQYYRPEYYRFIGANMVDPELLYPGPLGPDSVVLDVGAHNGDWAAHMVEKYDPRIVAFELDPATLPALIDRFRENPKVEVHGYGLHDRDDELRLSQRGMGSTTFEEPVPRPLGEPRVLVRVRDVASVLAELNVGVIDLMKVNIEGGEFALLDRLIETAWMCRIRCLMVQFHEWIDGAHYRRFRIRSALGRTHLEDWNYDFIWEKWTVR